MPGFRQDSFSSFDIGVFDFSRFPIKKKYCIAKLLEFAEQMAISRGNPSVLLQPDEVESDIPFQELIQWYIRKGYSWKEDDPKRMEKLI